jgi:hypothetical protein
MSRKLPGVIRNQREDYSTNLTDATWIWRGWLIWRRGEYDNRAPYMCRHTNLCCALESESGSLRKIVQYILREEAR